MCLFFFFFFTNRKFRYRWEWRSYHGGVWWRRHRPHPPLPHQAAATRLQDPLWVHTHTHTVMATLDFIWLSLYDVCRCTGLSRAFTLLSHPHCFVLCGPIVVSKLDSHDMFQVTQFGFFPLSRGTDQICNTCKHEKSAWSWILSGQIQDSFICGNIWDLNLDICQCIAHH